MPVGGTMDTGLAQVDLGVPGPVSFTQSTWADSQGMICRQCRDQQSVSVKGLIINILAFVNYTSLCLFISAFGAQKQPWALHQQMRMAVY